MRLGTSTALAAALSLALPGSLAFAPLVHAASDNSSVEIANDEFTLPNGLRVIVHTDRKAPIVAVNIWYHVGSKDESAGRTGFAHLFEHLMFQGSENHPDEYFAPFELAGTTDQNGTTNTDRTNYFQNVPTTALDMALWMESDRMGHLLGAIDQASLDEQRGVVQNEKRKNENQPYGLLREPLAKARYPVGHPYHTTTIGSMNDLNAASLEDVKTWFRRAYGPNNAVLVLAGDIDLETAKQKAKKYFGDIPAGPEFTQPSVNIAPLAANKRLDLNDRVPQVIISRVWNVLQSGSPEEEALELFGQVLGGSASSRLDKRLVFQEKLVDSTGAGLGASQLSGGFQITAAVKQGVDVKKVEVILEEELQKLLRDGPSAEELAQAKMTARAGFIRQIERIGGFGGKADVLAQCVIYVNDPNCYKKSLQRIENATPESVTAAARKWLNSGSLTATVSPGERTPFVEETSAVRQAAPVLPAVNPDYKVLASTVDRSKGVPVPASFPDLVFPKLQHAKLSNGLNVVLAARNDIPVVQFSMEFKGAGFASDQGRKLGTASFTMGMLDEGAGSLDTLALRERLEMLGAELGSGATLDSGTVYLSALKESISPSLQLFSDVIIKPRFDESDISRVRASWLASIKQERARPEGIAGRVMRPIVYGQGHPYAVPASGLGDEAGIASLTTAEMQAWRQQWLRPDIATLSIVGDASMAEILPLLEKQFADWKAPASPLPKASIPQAALPARTHVVLIDQPGAIQANIYVSQLVPSSNDENSTVFEIANSVLGGEFSSRLNMNLREDKHWSYGSYSSAREAVGQRLWNASAAVQIDKTAESVQELLREVVQFANGKAPATVAEVNKIQATEIRALPGAYETSEAVLGTMGGLTRYDRPDDYPAKRAALIAGLTDDQVNKAATIIKPDKLTVVVVGDLSKIKDKVTALNIGPVTVLDSDGKPVK